MHERADSLGIERTPSNGNVILMQNEGQETKEDNHIAKITLRQLFHLSLLSLLSLLLLAFQNVTDTVMYNTLSFLLSSSSPSP